MLELITAGESHGAGILCVLSGFPAGFEIDLEAVCAELTRRQNCAGRSSRKDLEKNAVEVLSGMRQGRTIGSPITIFIRNADSTIDKRKPNPVPRPGHAELPGMIRYGTKDATDIAERASARETAGRVAGGAICSQLLAELGVHVFGCTIAIGSEWAEAFEIPESAIALEELRALRNSNPYYAVQATGQWDRILSGAEKEGDTVGGVFGVISVGAPPGLGRPVQWTGNLDGRIARSLMSIQAVKAVEFGAGAAGIELTGSEYHGNIEMNAEGEPAHTTRTHGGILGGMTDGTPITVRCAVKPIPTTGRDMTSVNLETGEAVKRKTERHDICAVPAASVIGEHVLAFELCRATLERFGASSVDELRERIASVD
ncbi:MAG: chorismate synthase [Planctomycetota bacterium]|nr:MAG: chorismate synthase [Planctomycetota bacterium]